MPSYPLSWEENSRKKERISCQLVEKEKELAKGNAYRECRMLSKKTWLVGMTFVCASWRKLFEEVEEVEEGSGAGDMIKW